MSDKDLTHEEMLGLTGTFIEEENGDDIMFEPTPEPEPKQEEDILDHIEEPETMEVKEDKKETSYKDMIPRSLVTEKYSSPLTEEQIEEDEEPIDLPSNILKEWDEKLVKVTTVLKTMSTAMETWVDVMNSALANYTPGGMLQDRFCEEGSEFSQGIRGDADKLLSISPLKFKKSDGEVKGELAILKVAKFLGLGEVINIPLPHSGIWVTIKPPTEREMIDFYNNMYREKIRLGRATSGYTLTNAAVHVNNRLFEFILAHVHSVNYGDIPKEDLAKHMLVTDFHILAWGLACSIYPNGYTYQRACNNDIEECSYILKERLHLDKLLFIDNKSLTKAQRTILSENRPNKLTLESYKKYHAEHERIRGYEFTTANGINIKLKVPTFEDYATTGLRWVNTVTNMVEKAILGSDDKEQAREELLNQYVLASLLKQYSGYIDYIEVEGSVIKDIDTIDEVLELLSADDTTRLDISKRIIKYMSDVTIATIGIPEYDCPSCKHNQGNPDNPVKHVIPLDVMHMFFLVLTSRISKIMTRNI